MPRGIAFRFLFQVLFECLSEVHSRLVGEAEQHPKHVGHLVGRVGRFARLKRLVLTPIAIEQLAQMQQDILRVEQKATAGLTGEELKTLYVLLDKVIENLTPGKEERTID